MSELFDDDPRDTPPPRRSRPSRTRALVITAAVVILAFFALTTFAGLYTDRLWYHSVGFGGVFTTMFWTKVGLFLFFGVLMGAVVGVNMLMAYRLRPLFRPSSPEQTGLDRYRDAVTPIRTWLLIGVSVVVGLFAGASAVGQWRHYLLWRNGVPFGRNDDFFHKDVGFWVFDLPWLHFLVNFVMAATVVALVAAAVVHYLYGGVRLQTPHDRLSGPAQGQLSLLLGVFVLAKSADYYLDRFDLVTSGGGLITGMTYTDDHAVWPAKNILMFIALICAVLFFLNVWRRTWVLPSVGLALLALSAVLLGLIWPGIVQQFQVSPSEPDHEASYIAKNIKATRQAYDIASVKPTPYSDDASATNASLAALSAQTSSLPLVDPHLVHDTFEQSQQVRSYYSVADVLDVDRYDIQGHDRALVLGVRELDQAGISEGNRNWSNLHTVYTHGNGVIAAFANQRPANDKSESTDIQWAEGQQENNLGRYETRVYYGEQSPDYSVVGKEPGQPDVELNLGDTTSSNPQEDLTTYTGKGGVPVGSFFDQLMYAVKFGEPNFLLSERVNNDSQVLYNRTPRERVEKVAPWLTVDGDPYPAVVNHRIVWILDGYTTTDRYPSSERESFSTMTEDSLQNPATGLRTIPTDEINYMRDAVKATVDAYDGTVKLYAWDETDPILRAWESAFPNTVQPRAAIPDALMQHLRYPEDQFKVQRYQYARYHVTDARDFYTATNRWTVPEDPNSTGHLQPPYRLFVAQPTGKNGAEQEVFSLTSVFTPYGTEGHQRNNLAAFVSVDSDATDLQNYGKFRVLELPDQQTPGPGLIANQFTSNSQVANELAQFNRSGGETIPGNLLTVPIANGLIYVEPVYATRPGSSSSYPILQYVLTSYGGRTGIGRTLGDSLASALGVSPGSSSGGNQGTNQSGSQGSNGNQTGGQGNQGGNQGGSQLTGSVAQQVRSLLDRADKAFQQADTALSAHDTVTYAEKVQQARHLVERAVKLADQADQAKSKN